MRRARRLVGRCGRGGAERPGAGDRCAPRCLERGRWSGAVPSRRALGARGEGAHLAARRARRRPGRAFEACARCGRDPVWRSRPAGDDRLIEHRLPPGACRRAGHPPREWGSSSQRRDPGSVVVAPGRRRGRCVRRPRLAFGPERRGGSTSSPPRGRVFGFQADRARDQRTRDEIDKPRRHDDVGCRVRFRARA